MTDPAPYFADLAEGPEGGQAYWLTASDGVRIRAGLWPYHGDTPCKGTVFILPGRTECIEKYGRGAVDLAARGFASLAIDWRGQGLADRLLAQRSIGHVGHFPDYQRDLEAVIALAESHDMPKPWFLIGHSMGGAIGVRALIEGKPFSAAAFSAPMWGIGLRPLQKAMLRFLTPFLKLLGLENAHAPGTKPESYMVWHGFEDNLLTSDRETFDHITRQVVKQPDLSLGGPSSHWVTEAIAENDWARQQQIPDVPTLCFLGAEEKIVDTQAVKDFANAWDSCELIVIRGARHEIPMETPAIRAQFYDRLAEVFASQSL
nr:alpha/beta hydrolase [uncultured Celeribacter sp.]